MKVRVMGAVCPQRLPLLGLVSCIAPVIAVGNAVVVVPSEVGPLLATDLYQVLDTSDVPGGVVNIVTGSRAEIVPTLASHDDVDGIWHFGSAEDASAVERASTGNMKRTWVSYGRARDWFERYWPRPRSTGLDQGRRVSAVRPKNTIDAEQSRLSRIGRQR